MNINVDVDAITLARVHIVSYRIVFMCGLYIRTDCTVRERLRDRSFHRK